MTVKDGEIESHVCARHDIPRKEHTDNTPSSANDESAKLSHVRNYDQQGGGDTYALTVMTCV